MMMMARRGWQAAFLTFVGCVPVLGAGVGLAGTASHPPKIELTEVDITTVRNFRADDITVYGVALGMTQKAAGTMLERNPKLLVKPDSANPTRLYVYDKRPDGSANKSILYYIWEAEDPKLQTIVVFQDFAGYLKGSTNQLLALESLDPQSDIAKSFLGHSDRFKVTLDVPLAGVKNTTYYYDDKGLEITRKHALGRPLDSVAFSFNRDRKQQVAKKKAQVASPVTPPQTLDGCYVSTREVLGLTVLTRIEFKKDGTFVEDRPVAGKLVGDPGKYRIKGETIELSYANGRVKKDEFGLEKTGEIRLGQLKYVLGKGCGTPYLE